MRILKMLRHILLLIFTLVTEIHCHAIFWEPPSRASLGKNSHNFCNVPINVDHMSVYCGGISVQHKENEGKCGICGDPYNAPPEKKPHEVPGKFATGIITKSYFVPGQIIDVLIDVVANHLGFFAFRLCPNNNPNKDPVPECFEQYRLLFADGSDKFIVTKDVRKGKRIALKVKLPEGLRCWQCILQWTYVAGNNWGQGPQMADFHTKECLNVPDGKKGCGPQETFRGCADICIGEGCPLKRCQIAIPFDVAPTTTAGPSTSTSSSTSPSTSKSTTTTTTTTTPEPDDEYPDQPCLETQVKPPFDNLLAQEYCKEICLNQPMYICNLYICYCNTRSFLEF